MVSENPQNHHRISIPADWGIPKFHLAERVQAKVAFPGGTIRIQIGEISGIEYIKPDSFWVTRHGQKPGWHYFIHIETKDPWYFCSQVLCVEESDISEVT